MTTDAVGGVWQYATTLAAGLPSRGFEVLLAVLGPGPSAEQAQAVVRHNGLTLLPTDLPLDWLSGPEAVREAGAALATIARRNGAALVHLNSPTLAAERPFPVPVVAVAHGCVGTWWEAAHGEAVDGDFAWHAERMARGLRAADLAIAPSTSFAASLQLRYALPSRPSVVPNGRRIPLPVAGGEPERAALTVGRLWDRVKNATLLDEVAARLSAPFAAAGATTAPHGETVDLRHLAVLGHIPEEELAARIARRPVFVSAATFEPFGLAVLEAAGAGCALVLSDIPTFRELWDGAARFVSPNDRDGYVDAIEHLLADPAERARLGDAARQRALRYSAEQMVDAMAGHYAALLARRAAA